MALVPRLLRPSVVIRRKAMYQGLLGPSTFWKVIGVFVFGKSTLRKFFGKNPEVIDVSSLGAGRVMQVTTSTPMTRRRRRRAARRGQPVPSLAEDRALAQLWASGHSSRKAS